MTVESTASSELVDRLELCRGSGALARKVARRDEEAS